MSVVPHRPPPGPLPGALLGIVAGLFTGWIWMYGGRDVAFAFTAVMIGLAAVLVSAPGWRQFGTALAALAVLAGGGLVLLVWSARR
jgi:hypothetical protein